MHRPRYRAEWPGDAPANGVNHDEHGSVVDVSDETDAGGGTGLIRVFLLDDHELVRRGVGELSAAEPDLEVVGEAGTVADALARAEAARSDVALLDVRLLDGSGIEACRELPSRMPGLGCLMLISQRVR